MAAVTVLVCDKCGSQDGVETYEIRKAAERVSVDLCEADAAPLGELLTIGVKKPSAPRPVRSARAPRQKVTTIEEIEKLKHN